MVLYEVEKGKTITVFLLPWGSKKSGSSNQRRHTQGWEKMRPSTSMLWEKNNIIVGPFVLLLSICIFRGGPGTLKYFGPIPAISKASPY